MEVVISCTLLRDIFASHKGKGCLRCFLHHFDDYVPGIKKEITVLHSGLGWGRWWEGVSGEVYSARFTDQSVVNIQLTSISDRFTFATIVA